MSEEETVIEQNQEIAVSEQSTGEQQEEQDGQKTVPLSAMIATRKRAQEAEARAIKAETQAELYQQYINKLQTEVKPNEEAEDPRAIVERKDLHESTAQSERRILETIYQQIHPEAVQKINKYLQPILEKKSWLASTIDEAPNRYARAYEIVQDYIGLVEEKPVAPKSHNTDGQRIVQNAQKPRSPADVGKSARPEGMDYLKSIQGKQEFRDYRKKVLRGEA